MEIANRKSVRQYTDFIWLVALNVVDSDPVAFLDLTGYHFYMQVRDESATLLASAVCSIVTHPTTSEANKAVRISISHTVTATMPSGSHKYDACFSDPSGTVFPLPAGEFFVYPGITVIP